MEKHLPMDLNAERAVLGSILIDPEAIVLVADFLISDAFYHSAHGKVFEVMNYLYERQEPSDYVSICSELERRNFRISTQEPNESYLVGLLNDVPTSGNIEYYGHIVEKCAVRRSLINYAGLVATSAQNDEADEALATAEEQLFAIGQKRNSNSYSILPDLMTLCVEKMEEASRFPSALIGVPTGFTDLDRLLKGLRKSGLYIIAGRPGMGKTSLALSMALSISTRQHLNVAFFSLEMSKIELSFRMLSCMTGIDSDTIQSGQTVGDDWSKVENAMGVLSDSTMLIDDTTMLSVAQLRSRCLQMRAKHGLDAIFVDYLQLLTATQRDGKMLENRVQEVSIISRALKALAKELNIPVVALAQLSRAVETRAQKIPQLSDLRESGSIEADADGVLFIYRDDVYNFDSDHKGTADIIVAKHRQGAIGEVRLSFTSHCTRFANLEVIPQEGALYE